MRPFRIAFLSTISVMLPGAFANILTYDTTILSTNYVTGAVGMRDVGAGNLVIAGIPSGSTVTQSLLFWHGPTNSTDPNVNASVTVAGNSVTGTNIGVSGDNFWASLNSQAYKADVTSIINGNGTYALSGFQKASAQINGAADFTFYNSGLSTGKQDVILYDGNDSNFASANDPAGWNFTANGITYSGGSAFLTLYVSDGQNFGPADDGTLTINGVTLATGGLFQGLAPRAAGAGVSNGDLTDVITFNITSFLTPGNNNLNVQLGPGFSDALSLVGAAFVVPAGDAPPTQATPEPATFVLVGLSLAGLWRYRSKIIPS
jgi:hypothetical protein